MKQIKVGSRFACGTAASAVAVAVTVAVGSSACTSDLAGSSSPSSASAPAVQVVRQALRNDIAQPWSHGNIGDVAASGDWDVFGSVYGTLKVEGSGAGIGGTGDEYFSVHQAMPADAILTVRVVSLDDPSPNAQAGIIMRNSAQADDQQVTAFVTPTPANGYCMQIREVQGETTSCTPVGAGTLPVWLRLIRQGGTLTGQYSSDGSSWSALGSVNMSFGELATAGLAVSSNDDGDLAHAVFDNVNYFQSQDVGAVAAAGSWGLSGSVHTVSGSGADIWNTADEFRYVYQTVTNDATITARVATLCGGTPGSCPNVWTKAGVMIREGSETGARNAHALVTPTTANKYRFQTRTTTDGTTATASSAANSAVPVWLRVTRAGDVFSAFHSSNGTSWTQIGSNATISMSSTLQMGLAVTSHSDGTLATATFDNVTITPAIPTGAAPTLTATGGNGQVSLSWTDNSSNEFRFRIERKPAGAPDDDFAEIAFVDANVTSYLDTPVATGSYTYRVRATNFAGDSGYSNSDDATVQVVDVEAESLTRAVSSGDTATDETEVDASNGLHVQLRANASNDYVEYTINAPVAATYQIAIRWKRNTNRGKYELYHVQGMTLTQVGSEQDQYGSSGFFSTVIGTRALTSGNNVLRMTVTGKNGSSSDWDLSADKFTLTAQ